MSISRHPLSGNPPPWSKIRTDQGALRALRASLDTVLGEGTRVAPLFYARLFERYPALRRLFPADMRAQEKKLVDMLRTVITNLENPEAVRGALRELGKRHVNYGAVAEHYPLVCAALIDAMAEAAGSAWTPELAEEWRQALHIVSKVMQDGAAAITGPKLDTQAPTATPPTRG